MVFITISYNILDDLLFPKTGVQGWTFNENRERG